MRLAISLPASLMLAFGMGVVASPWLQRAMPDAHAQALSQNAAASGAISGSVPAAASPGLVAALIDIAAIRDSDLSGAPGADIRSKPYVVTDNATIGVQMGNVGRHYHSRSDEIQYIVEGSGTAWLGDKKVDIRPGMMLVIPRGTNHAGTEATTGRFKAIAIKIPPQAAGDTTFVP